MLSTSRIQVEYLVLDMELGVLNTLVEDGTRSNSISLVCEESVTWPATLNSTSLLRFLALSFCCADGSKLKYPPQAKTPHQRTNSVA